MKNEQAVYVAKEGESFPPLTLDECIENINSHDNRLDRVPNGRVLCDIAKRNEAMLGIIELLRANNHAENADSASLLTKRHSSALILALDVLALDISMVMDGLING